MSKITKLVTAHNIKIIEDLVKDKTYLDELIIDINKLISNCQTDYNIELDDVEDDIKYIYIGEIKNIIKNLSIIICKYFEKKPDSLISLDLDNAWYLSEKTIYIKKTGSNPYVKNITISKILTVICKLIDYLNEYHLNHITNIDKKIDYLKNKLKTEQDTVSVFQYTLLTQHFNKIIEQLETSKKKYIVNFKDVYQLSKPILLYFINIFNSDFTNRIYLEFTPITLLNIFQSSLYFLTDDSEFLNFIVKFKNWLPSDYRCKYGVEIIKLLNDKDLDYNTKQILKNFEPNAHLLIDDIISMYWKTNKDPSIIIDICTLHFILTNVKDKIIWSEIDNEKIILFISVELSLISKFNKTEINNDEIYESILKTLLIIIDHGLTLNTNLFDTYLVYSIPNKLFSLYDGKYLNNDIIIHLDNIFRLYLSSKLGIYYLSSMIELDQISKLPTNSEQNEKFIKWLNYYKYINDNVSETDITDPLTTSVLVIPYVIPMNNNFTICNMCDKNIIESYLWDKKENPFTRTELTIEKLKDFNNLKKNVDLVKDTKSKLNLFIANAKKSIGMCD